MLVIILSLDPFSSSILLKIARLNLPTLCFKNDPCNLIIVGKSRGAEKNFHFFQLSSLDKIKMRGDKNKSCVERDFVFLCLRDFSWHSLLSRQTVEFRDAK